ncbi:RmlC-like cupin domain-containing protein [Chytridium lagenaria]|nr:RmlC-like cupin domain-containing protein [Chytridium lagenaria]
MHRLKYATQSYDWGKPGSTSKVSEFALSDPSFTLDPSKPYAELWMGTHPNAPSYLYEQPSISLKSVLTPQNLSKGIHERYQGDLPFLFKILSIGKALSIQAHPDKTLAKELHEKFPHIYKDSNHKPEMAIALTPFEAFIGFRPLPEIKSHLHRFPEFSTLLPSSIVTSFQEGDGKPVLRALFQSLMNAPEDAVKEAVERLVGRFEEGGMGEGKRGGGCGECFCAFLLNYVELKVGEGIFLAANEPHAYLSGDCVECMAASDNVVRSGLTPKFKDVDTLVSMLTYNHGSASSQILCGVPLPPPSTSASMLYDPPIEEFAIVRVVVHVGVEGPSVVVVTRGGGVGVVEGVRREVRKGEVYFLEAGVGVEWVGGDGEGMELFRAYCTL